MTGTEPPPVSGAMTGKEKILARIPPLEENEDDFKMIVRILKTSTVTHDKAGALVDRLLATLQALGRSRADLAGLRAALADKPGAGLVVGQKYKAKDVPVGSKMLRWTKDAEAKTIREFESGGKVWWLESNSWDSDDIELQLVALPPQSTPADAQPTQMPDWPLNIGIVADCLFVEHGKRRVSVPCADIISAAIKGGV